MNLAFSLSYCVIIWVLSSYMHLCNSCHFGFHLRNFGLWTWVDLWKEYSLQLLRLWRFEDLSILQSYLVSTYLLPLYKGKVTSSHSSVNFDKLSVFVERYSWTLLASSYQSTQHHTTSSHCQGLAHVYWVFVSTVWYQRNVVEFTDWSSILKSWKLRNSTSCHNSCDTNTSISNSTTNSISSTSDQILSSFSSCNWTWNNINWRELFF